MLLRRRDTMLVLAAGGLAALLPRTGRAAAATIEGLRKAGEIAIGCEATYPPFSFRKGMDITGYDVEVATRVFKPIGVVPRFVDTEWAGVIPSLYAGRFDLIMSSLSYTRERMQKVAYTIPYAEASQALLVRAADRDTIRGIDDMSGRVLGIKLGSPGATMQASLDERVAAARGKGFASVKTYDDHPSAYLALAQGTVDGVLNTLPTLGDMLRTSGARFAIVRDIGRQNWAGIAARKEDTELVAFVDGQLRAAEADGSLGALQEKWFGLRFDLPSTLPAL